MSAPAIVAVVEQIVGGLLLLLLLLDVLMTVLYARIGSGIVSRRLAKADVKFALSCFSFRSEA